MVWDLERRKQRTPPGGRRGLGRDLRTGGGDVRVRVGSRRLQITVQKGVSEQTEHKTMRKNRLCVETSKEGQTSSTQGKVQTAGRVDRRWVAIRRHQMS